MTELGDAEGSRQSVRSDAIRWFSHERTRRSARRVKWGTIAAYLLAVGGIGVVPLFGWVALIAAILAFAAWIVEMLSGPWLLTEGESEPGTLVLERGKLVISSATVTESLDATQIDSGWVEDPDHVVLALRDGRTVSAHLPNREERSALMHALGVGAADRVLRVPVYSRVGGFPAGELVAALAAICVLPAAAGAWSFASAAVWEALAGKLVQGALAFTLGSAALVVAITTLLAWVLLASVKKRHVVIGTDGIVIEGAWRRVIPFSEIAEVTLGDMGASIRCKNGKIVRLPTGRRDPAFPTALGAEEAARARRLVERASAAMSASGKSRGVEQKAAWLESSGRSLEAWRGYLEKLGERVGDYRRPGITNDELLEIARDAARILEQRSAAMFLIGKRGADKAPAEAAITACADSGLAERLSDALGGELSEEARESVSATLHVRVADADLRLLAEVQIEEARQRALRDASD